MSDQKLRALSLVCRSVATQSSTDVAYWFPAEQDVDTIREKLMTCAIDASRLVEGKEAAITRCIEKDF